MTMRAVLRRMRSRLPSWNWIKLMWSFLRAGAPLWLQIERAGLWPYIALAVLISICTRLLSITPNESDN